MSEGCEHPIAVCFDCREPLKAKVGLESKVFSYLRARVRRELDACDAADEDVSIEAERILRTIDGIDAMSHGVAIELMLGFLGRFEEA